MKNSKHFELRKNKLVVFFIWLTPLIILGTMIYIVLFDLKSEEAMIGWIVMVVLLFITS